MSLDQLYDELEVMRTAWGGLEELLSLSSYDFDRERPILDQQPLGILRKRVNLAVEVLLSLRSGDPTSVEYVVVGARIQDMRGHIQSFSRHTDSTVGQLRSNWREGVTIRDGNDNFLWQLFDGGSAYVNLDMTPNLQQMNASLNALIGIAGSLLPLCRATAVGDLVSRAEALNRAARDAESARKQAQTHANAAGGSATRAAEREKTAQDVLTQTQTVLAGLREQQVKATADASSVTTLVEQIKTTGANAGKLEALVSTYQNKFEAFQSQLDARTAAFAKFESDAGEANKANLDREADIDRLMRLSDAMISGATTAGLANSLEQTRKRYEERMNGARTGFQWSVALLVVSALPLAAHLLPGVFGDWFPKISESAHDSWYGVLGKILLMVPATWLTAFYTKSFADFFHLEREYAHKAALAMSVDGFKRQAPGYEQEITAEVFMEIRNNPAKGHPVEPASHPLYDVLGRAVSKALDKRKGQ